MMSFILPGETYVHNHMIKTNLILCQFEFANAQLNKFNLARQAELFYTDFRSSCLPRFDLCKANQLDDVKTKWK